MILKEGITIQMVYEDFIKQGKSYKNPFEDATMIQNKIPMVAEKTMKLADEAKAGIWKLPGCSEKRFIGNPPLWHDNPFQNNEYVFQISRMLNWLPMLHAYYITKDETYAQKIVSEMMDWIEQCKRPELAKSEEEALAYFNAPSGKAWRLLECGIRPYKVWIPVLEGLAYSSALTVDVFEKALVSLCEQCEVVAKLSPVAWPKADHNHFLMENLGLLAVAGSFPQLAKSQEWLKQGIDGFNRSIEAQVLDSGAQIEGCPSYHNGCIFWFATAIQYSKKYGFDLSASYRKKFDKMVEYSVYATRPNGTNVPWGDTSTISGGLIDGAMCSYLGNGNLEWLKVARSFYSYEEILDAAVKQIWKMDDKEEFCDYILTLKEKGDVPPLKLSYWDKQLKHVFMRTDWSKDACSVMFSCRTPVQNLHAHIDPNAFDFTAYGTPLVVDPGKYTYKNGEDRKNFKSMKWHNTLTINQKNAWEYLHSWGYGPQKEGNIVNAEFEPDFMWTIGTHRNYEPIIHTRGLALVDKKWVLVLDFIELLQGQEIIDINMHLDSQLCSCELQRVKTSHENSANVCLLSTAPNVCLSEAKISDENDVWRPSTLAQFQWINEECVSKKAFATIIYPMKPQEKEPQIELQEVIINDNNIEATIILNQEQHQICFDIEHHCMRRL